MLSWQCHYDSSFGTYLGDTKLLIVLCLIQASETYCFVSYSSFSDFNIFGHLNIVFCLILVISKIQTM